MTSEISSPNLLLAGGASAMRLSIDVLTIALAQATARGIRTHVTNTAETLAATPEVAMLADAASPVDFEQPLHSADWARAQAVAGERFDIVFGVREMAQIAVAEMAAAVGAPGNPPDAVRRVRTKDACRAALAAAGFRQPAVTLCRSVTDARDALRSTVGPWVVKPRDAMGSEGVRMVTCPEELPAAVAELPDQEEFLVESYVSGPEFSVEGVFLDGRPRVLAITAKRKTEPPYFVEIGHVLPAALPDAVRAEMEDRVTAALIALGLGYGLFHVELWHTDEGVVLGEVHVRNGGGWIHRMLAYAYPGLEMFGLVFDDALGRPVSVPEAPQRAAATRFLTPPAGRLVSVTGWTEVAAHPAVLYAELEVEPGATIRPLHSGEDRVGVVVVGAATPEAAEALADELVASIRFAVDPAMGAGAIHAAVGVAASPPALVGAEI